MLLAARALGLGTTLTTLYLLHEKETEAAMGLPEEVHSYAILPLDSRWGSSVRCGGRRWRMWFIRSLGAGVERKLISGVG